VELPHASSTPARTLVVLGTPALLGLFGLGHPAVLPGQNVTSALTPIAGADCCWGSGTSDRWDRWQPWHSSSRRRGSNSRRALSDSS
jgi:hypothetical protein